MQDLSLAARPRPNLVLVKMMTEHSSRFLLDMLFPVILRLAQASKALRIKTITSLHTVYIQCICTMTLFCTPSNMIYRQAKWLIAF